MSKIDFFSFLIGERFPENYYVTFVEFAAKDAVEKTALTDMAAKVNYIKKTTKLDEKICRNFQCNSLPMFAIL